jgi:predicted RNase H-like HicB family nuclease
MRPVRLTVILERDSEGYVALCPEIDVARQGRTLDEARANVEKAVELFFEKASDAKVAEQLPSEVRIEPLEVTVG